MTTQDNSDLSEISDDTIVTMLEVMRELTFTGNPWKEKAARVKAVADKTGFISELEEFVAWFPPEDDD